MKKTSKYSEYFYNKGPTDLVISDINLKIRSGRSEDLFLLNPLLSYDLYLESFHSGMIRSFIRMNKLIHLKERPIENTPDFLPLYDAPGKPIPNRSKSVLIIDQSIKNYVDQLEAEFLGTETPMSDQKEMEITQKFIKEVDLEGFSDPLEDD